MGVALSDDDKRAELVDRLILSRWAEQWSAEYPVGRFGTIRSASNFVETMQRLVGREVGLQAELSSVSGLPQEAFGTMTRQELVENIKTVLLWKELPLDDLQEECLRLSLSWRVDQEGLSVQQQQQELRERLVMASCAKAWEAEGLPVKRLGSAEAAVALRRRWQGLDGLGVEELRRQYADLGLPTRAPQPKVLDFLPRLRQAALWAALPLGELQRECRQLGLEQGTSSREQALKALICGTWAPPDDANDASEDFWKSAAGKEAASGNLGAKGPSSEKLRKMAVHFQTLGLEPNAGHEELKRSYRKLVLQYHPDKNPGAAAEAAARRFREVSEAYEALTEFMKVRS
ncbi:dnaJ [Symbiodinium natans]|uniref:DnaJ protein n=1 Tax=Symbiodinium natans TaxID=878477 RepID=A0A812LFW2_9DINO|nr:dnaJ [Symbiodinium natans]